VLGPTAHPDSAGIAARERQAGALACASGKVCSGVPGRMRPLGWPSRTLHRVALAGCQGASRSHLGRQTAKTPLFIGVRHVLRNRGSEVRISKAPNRPTPRPPHSTTLTSIWSQRWRNSTSSLAPDGPVGVMGGDTTSGCFAPKQESSPEAGGSASRACWSFLAARSSYWRMFTARETTRPIVTSDTSDWAPMMLFAVGVSGNASVGLNAVALVSDTYR